MTWSWLYLSPIIAVYTGIVLAIARFLRHRFHQPKGIPMMSTLSEIAADIEHRFSFHPNLSDAIAKAHEDLRTILATAAKDAVAVAGSVAGPSRELSLALTALEEADHWLHAHVARNQPVAPVAPVDAVAAPVAVPEVTVAAPVATPAAAPVATPTPDVPAETVVATPAPVVDMTAAITPPLAPPGTPPAA